MKSDGHAATEVSRATDPRPPEGLAPPAVTVEYGQRDRIVFPPDQMWWEEIRLLVGQLVGNVVALYREDSRAAALHAKGSAPTQDMLWRRSIHESAIAIARGRLQKLGALSEGSAGNPPTA